MKFRLMVSIGLGLAVICGPGVPGAPFSSAVTDEITGSRAPERPDGHPETSLKYRGVVAMDVGDDNLSANVTGSHADELVLDLGASGVWLYNGAAWQKLGDGSGYPGTWAKINNGSPDQN